MPLITSKLGRPYQSIGIRAFSEESTPLRAQIGGSMRMGRTGARH
jgi:hypothetical protein